VDDGFTGIIPTVSIKYLGAQVALNRVRLLRGLWNLCYPVIRMFSSSYRFQPSNDASATCFSQEEYKINDNITKKIVKILRSRAINERHLLITHCCCLRISVYGIFKVFVISQQYECVGGKPRQS
jgi:hypothetical protein